MKAINYVFILLFLVTITLPLILIDTKSTISEQENRTLAVFPDVINDGKINRDAILHFSKLIDDYIGDRFGFKKEAAAFIHSINRKSGAMQQGTVIFGRKDWLFYSTPGDGDNISDFLKMNLFSQKQIDQFTINIEDRLAWCNNNGIKFIFLIAPNKHNIYPEYYPVKRPRGITRTDQIINSLPDNLKDVVIYPRDYILSKKTVPTPVYYETDTHWNMLGASYAYNLFFEKMKKDFPGTIFPDIEFIMDVHYDSSGDIVSMSGLTSYGKRTIPDIHPKEGWSSYYTSTKNEDPNGIITENKNPDLPRAIIFRDSFFSALEPFTSTMFSSAEYNWRWFNESEKEYILKNKPDIIIWEVVERSITGIPYAAWN